MCLLIIIMAMEITLRRLRVDEEPKDGVDLAHYDSLSEIKLGKLFIEEFYRAYSN